MSLTLRVRHRDGAMTIPDICLDATVADLQRMIAAGTGVPAERQVLKVGVPPVVLSSELGNAVKLGEVGINNRDTVVVEESAQPFRSSAAGRADPGEPVCSTSGSVALPLLTTASNKPACAAKKRSNEQVLHANKAACAALDKTRSSEQVNVGNDAPDDPRARDMLPAFDRAIAAASKHAGNCPEDKHHAWALRKGKLAVVESIKRGDNISLSALHTLTGVGHWVVQQVKEHMILGTHNEWAPPKRSRIGQRAAPPPTPSSFTWKYLGRNGKPVVFRNDAEMSQSPTGPLYCVSIVHASGRVEKGWLPDSKAPPQGPE